MNSTEYDTLTRGHTSLNPFQNNANDAFNTAWKEAHDKERMFRRQHKVKFVGSWILRKLSCGAYNYGTSDYYFWKTLLPGEKTHIYKDPYTSK